MTGLLTIGIIFLPAICGEYSGEYQELKLISKLNKLFKFDHNIFLLDASTDSSRLIDTNVKIKVTPTSVYVFKDTGNNITVLENLTKIKSKNTFVIVSPAASNIDKNINLLTLLKKIQRLQIKMKIGIFFQDIASSDDLQKLFEWSWQHRIINIFAATYLQTQLSEGTSADTLLNVFTFNPFGTLDVINVTGSVDIFLKQNCNFQQHPLRVIRYRSDYFWPTALAAMNASYTELKYNSSTFADVYENQLDAALGVTISVYPNPMAIVKYNTLVIVVPEALPFGEFAAYLQAITKDSFFGYSLIIIVGVMLTLSFVRYMTRKIILFLESVADVLNLLMNDNASIRYQQLYRSEVFLIVPLTFVGLVIVNGIFSNFQSYLTQPILQHQINTIEDIYNSPLPIVAQSEYQKNYVTGILTNLLERKDWKDKILIDEGVYGLAEKYNRSLTFLSQLDVANKLVRVQKKLGIKCYYITEKHIEKYFNSYIVHKAFPFIERLNEIIHRLQSAGLYDEWRRREDYVNDKKFFEEKLPYFKSHKQSDDADDINRFPIPMFIFYGWIASTILLIVEIIWKNIHRILTEKLR